MEPPLDRMASPKSLRVSEQHSQPAGISPTVQESVPPNQLEVPDGVAKDQVELLQADVISRSL
jgi:hypothetical protein